MSNIDIMNSITQSAHTHRVYTEFKVERYFKGDSPLSISDSNTKKAPFTEVITLIPPPSTLSPSSSCPQPYTC